MGIGKNYDIIIGTITTEKTTKVGVPEKYFFEVVNSATKKDIKNAIQSIFDVVVESVNVINTLAKTKRFKGVIGKRNSTKKAVVTLKKGQNINFSKLE